MVTLEQLLPADHLLCQISRYIDFSFIRDQTFHLYCAENGRPALDPVVLFKMLFIGYLFGICSERRLVKKIEANVAYRWFFEMRLTERVPNAWVIGNITPTQDQPARWQHLPCTPASGKKARKSAELLLPSGVPYEIRTTGSFPRGAEMRLCFAI